MIYSIFNCSIIVENHYKIIMLGDKLTITLSTDKFSETLRFFELLGFTTLTELNAKNNWRLITDGVVLLLVVENSSEYIELTYQTKSYNAALKKFESIGLDKIYLTPKDVKVSTPGGLGIHLINIDGADFIKPSGNPTGKCGRFHEISLGVEDIYNALDVYGRLGFNYDAGTVVDGEVKTGMQWASMNDGKIRLGLYQFENENPFVTAPTLCYYASDMTERIEAIQSEGIEFIKILNNDSGEPHHGILKTPGGQQLFLFNQ